MDIILVAEEPKRGKGRPPKPPEDQTRTMTVRVSNRLYDEASRWIPEGERSEIIRTALIRAIAAKKRAARDAKPPLEEGEE